MQIPMDVFVHIIEHARKSNGKPSYSACLTIGRQYLQLDENSKEVFYCGAAGKSFFACIDAIKERVLVWAKGQGIEYISGLTDNKPCPLILSTEHEDITVAPITYNDWLTEPTYLCL